MYIKNSEDINNNSKNYQWNPKNDIDNEFSDSKKIEKRDFFSWHKNNNIKYYDYYNAPHHDYFDIPPDSVVATEADVKNKLDQNNESINIAPISNGNTGTNNLSNGDNNNSNNNNSVDGVNTQADKGKGLGTSQSNISSTDKTGNEPNSISGILIIILSILALLVVGIVFFVHKKKLFKKDTQVIKEEIAVEVMNTYPTLNNSKSNTEEHGLDVMDTYQNITSNYSDTTRQDQSSLFIENYQHPLGSNVSTVSPVSKSFNFSSSGYDSSRQFIDSKSIKSPESAVTSRIDHSFHSKLNYY
ncbi:hypothetical protein U3516DRAFT_620449 [Neocallimastix sp. 'constans']